MCENDNEIWGNDIAPVETVARYPINKHVVTMICTNDSFKRVGAWLKAHDVKILETVNNINSKRYVVVGVPNVLACVCMISWKEEPYVG